jgi:hypothetical protein
MTLWAMKSQVVSFYVYSSLLDELVVVVPLAQAYHQVESSDSVILG